MTTRADLAADIVGWTGHNFDASKISSIIRLAEANIGRDVRINAMYTTDAGFVIDGPVIPLPYGMAQVTRFRLDGYGKTLEFMTPNAFYDSCQFDQSGGTPEVYTIEGGNFIFAPAPVGEFTGLLGYLRRFDPLVADDDTNLLLNDNYDVYLFACLSVAFSFAQDDQQAEKYLGRYQVAVESLNASDQFMARQGNALRRHGNGSY